jgi:hypothetical protein
MEKINAFMELKKELYDSGVIGLNMYDADVQVKHTALLGEEKVEIETRNCSEYPFQVFIVEDGIKVFALLSFEESKQFPQFKEQVKAELQKQLKYLEEDVDLSGGEELVGASIDN